MNLGTREQSIFENIAIHSSHLCCTLQSVNCKPGINIISVQLGPIWAFDISLLSLLDICTLLYWIFSHSCIGYLHIFVLNIWRFCIGYLQSLESHRDENCLVWSALLLFTHRLYNIYTFYFKYGHGRRLVELTYLCLMEYSTCIHFEFKGCWVVSFNYIQI